ncbi:DUF4013 domain-containing protein [Methanobrevibacter sp.]|uniref:DUF4013 domain-containing protein n=1 Tax=Methanobrevibacter sp. TaxID=66852 RepID=UPI00386B4848
MPHVILKRVWDYCTYSKEFFAFVLILLFVSSLIQNYVTANGDSIIWVIVQILVFISVSGYGMSITRSRINHGRRLPKIIVKDIIVLGFKSAMLMCIYVFIQGEILHYVCSFLNFSAFNLEELLLHWTDTIHLLLYHEPVTAVLFLILGSAIFYVTAFFMEISLAKLADTGSIFSALNFMSIKRDIDVVGWRHYAKDYTLIALAIVFLTYLISFDIPFIFIDSIFDMILTFLIFATQYLGIGAVYCEIKDLKKQ